MNLGMLKDFKFKRWHSLVPLFDHDKFQYEIDIHQLLPFTTKVSHKELNNGNFSEVSCVKMLARKQTKIPSSDETIVVALKTLQRISEPQYDLDKEWRREAKAHKQLNNTRAHIIQAIAAYRQIAADRQNDTYHLVLEWADGGSLLSFWDNNLGPQVDGDIGLSRKRIMEMLKQLRGLADALEGMHTTSSRSPGSSRRSSSHISVNLSSVQVGGRNTASLEPPPPSGDESPSLTLNLQRPEDPQESEENPALSASSPESGGLSVPAVGGLIGRNMQSTSENWRHGDIKPENILRFVDGNEDAWIGTLKLADLGRAQQHLLRTKLRESREKELWRTRWYEPPDLVEEVHEQAQGKISRLFDIWSIGCDLRNLNMAVVRQGLHQGLPRREPFRAKRRRRPMGVMR
jgi:serine/threonine protein kinase